MAKKQDELTELEQPFDFETAKLETIEDFAIWNSHAHRAFREAKKMNPKCDPPIKVRVPDESFHKKVKVKFQRFDQPENVLKTCLRTKDIEWKGELIPGRVYDLPLAVVRYLNNLCTPIFAEVKVESGGEVKTETKQVGEKNRFSCHLMEIA